MSFPGLPSGAPVATTTPIRVINGHEIGVVAEDYLVATGQDLASYTPVSANEAGEIVRAVFGTPAIGITSAPVSTIAGGTKPCSIVVAAVLNPKALAWDESFDTEAKQVAAFRGAPSPTNILVKPSA